MFNEASCDLKESMLERMCEMFFFPRFEWVFCVEAGGGSRSFGKSQCFLSAICVLVECCYDVAIALFCSYDEGLLGSRRLNTSKKFVFASTVACERLASRVGR
jgi:hypothetical protein